MKITAAFFLALFFTSFAQADGLKKIDSITATKQFISTNNQAGNFIDAVEINEFIDMMKSDPSSPLAQLIENIELDNNCTGRDKAENGCGRVVITSYTLTGFERGGWQSAIANYRFYVGYQEEGTSHFFRVSHVFEVTESVEAQNIPDEMSDMPIEFQKTYHFTGARDITKDVLK